MKAIVRDLAIDVITSNLVDAGCLLQAEVPTYMARLHQDYDTHQLAGALVESRRLSDMALEMRTILGKN